MTEPNRAYAGATSDDPARVAVTAALEAHAAAREMQSNPDATPEVLIAASNLLFRMAADLLTAADQVDDDDPPQDISGCSESEPPADPAVIHAGLAYEACRSAASQVLWTQWTGTPDAAGDDGAIPPPPSAEEYRAQFDAARVAVTAASERIAEAADQIATIAAQGEWPECVGIAVSAAYRMAQNLAAQRDGRADAFGTDPDARYRSWEGRYDGAA